MRIGGQIDFLVGTPLSHEGRRPVDDRPAGEIARPHQKVHAALSGVRIIARETSLLTVIAGLGLAAAAPEPRKIVFARVFPQPGQIGLFIAAADGSTFEHVRRELNQNADRLSNAGMDADTTAQNLPPSVSWIREYHEVDLQSSGRISGRLLEPKDRRQGIRCHAG